MTNLAAGFMIVLINPEISILLLAIISELRSLSPRLGYLWAFAFTTQVVLREFDVEFAIGSTDDIPNYIHIFDVVKGYDFFELFKSEFVNGELEPVFIATWKMLSLFISDHSTLFYIYIYICTVAIIFLCKSISPRYMWNLLLVAFVVFPTTLTYEFLHLYRAVLCSVFLSIAINPNIKKRIIWIALAVFSHITALLFAVIYGYNRLLTSSKSKFKIILILALFAISFYFVGGEIVISKFYRYYNDQNLEDRTFRMYKSLLLIAYLLYVYQYHRVNNILKSEIQTLICIGVFGLIPIFSAVVDRLWMMYLPLFIVSLIPINNFYCRIVTYIISIPGLMFLLSPGSITRFSNSVFNHPLNIPIVDFIYQVN